MRHDERDALRRRFHFRCGYCGVAEQDAGAELTVDHFQPRSHGGPHQPKNWVYCCHACNEFKGNIWSPESPRRILHPLQADFETHIVERGDGSLQGLSETGEFHITRLRLNRPQLIEYRRERQALKAAQNTQKRILLRLQELEEQLLNLISRLEQLERDDAPPG